MRPLFARPSLFGALLAVLVGLAAYVYLSGSQAAGGATDDVERVSVVVAAKEIALRARVQGADLQLKQLPASAVHPLAVRSVEAAAGQYAISPVRTGEQLLSVDLGAQPGGGPLAQLVPAGMRAISIGVSDAMAVGGLVQPGDRVDVVALFEESKVGGDGAVHVAQDVEILAVSSAVLGQEVESKADKKGNPTSISATVTLALPFDVAQKVALADEFGALRLVLRRPGEPAGETDAPFDLKQLTGGLTPANPGSSIPFPG